MESPTTELTKQLLALGLCTERDLRRCRARVRRLCRDLPPFDSVWLDALVQMGRLTPYQARQLAEDSPQALSVGPLVLVERLGTDGRLTRFTARRPPQRELVEVTFVAAPAAERPAVLERLRQTIERWPPHLDRRAARPTAAHLDRDRLVVVSAHAPGRTLAELLVRRGRLPLTVVVEIARQMTAALEVLERADLLHGDLRLRNVCLDPHGRVVLLQTGILAAAQPLITIHSDIPADCYDGIAPELIETHAERTIASELYACGCLWWQLLAGRPPFPGGDPLAKLARHQTCAVEDVRVWRPETPSPLADLLRQMTSRDPAQRPRSFTEAAALLRRPTTSASPRLRRFARSFESAAPAANLDADGRRRSVLPLATAMALAFLAGLAGLYHFGPRGELLSVARAAHHTTPAAVPPIVPTEHTAPPVPLARTHHGGESIPRPSREGDAAVQPLPEPVQGVIHLTSPGPYRARDLVVLGPLVIRGEPAVRPRIVVDHVPWQLTATTVLLEQLDILRPSSIPSPPSLADDGALVSVAAQDVGVSGCRLEWGASQPEPVGVDRPRSLLRWRLIETADAAGGRAGIQQTLFLGGGDALACEQTPRSVLVQQSLKLGRGALVSLPPESRAGRVAVTVRDSTVRGCDALVAWSPSENISPKTLHLTLERSVIAPHDSGGLVCLSGGDQRQAPRRLAGFHITGLETLLQAGSPPVMLCTPVGALPLEASSLSIEGVQYAQLTFAGSQSRRPSDARLQAVDGSPLAARIWGCPPHLFSVWEPATYNESVGGIETPAAAASREPASAAVR